MSKEVVFIKRWAVITIGLVLLEIVGSLVYASIAGTSHQGMFLGRGVKEVLVALAFLFLVTFIFTLISCIVLPPSRKE